MATVVLVGTLDTKGIEYEYLRGRLKEHGVEVVVVDVGILGEPRTEPDCHCSERSAPSSSPGEDECILTAYPGTMPGSGQTSGQPGS